jgi:phosphate starvation-inducible PhoH-like protein
MSETTFSITNPDEILALFGPRDQHLRRLRKLFDVQITQRNGNIRISGEDEPVQQAARTLKKLRHLSRKQGELNPGDIDKAAIEEGAAGNPTHHRGALHQPSQVRRRDP